MGNKNLQKVSAKKPQRLNRYLSLFSKVTELIDESRQRAARSIDTLMASTYWGIGQIIVEREQSGAHRAAYGEELIQRLAADLTARYGRGFSERNLEQMRRFYLGYPKAQTASAKSSLFGPLPAFALPWSQYVLLLSVSNQRAREFYEKESLRVGWNIRQLKRQINTQFYERTALSKNKAAMLKKGERSQQEDWIEPSEQIKDPLILEFLGLKDEYSESDLEEALINRLEEFLLELGGDFTFVGRQRRLRIGDEWYRVDLVFFHRVLRCLIVVDLKIGAFTHADAGQMHLYLNYAREHWMRPHENPPVGLILCASKDAAVAKYALGDLPNKIIAAEYKTALPKEKLLEKQINQVRNRLLKSK